jgi:D-alanyl-D-alanine carboxypeptidase (penicillin-binding protein 5/6)|tara:strand:- start:347 stop:1507 length:1161 start_codon:yes stop_codon:yes gene_type:complete
MIKTIKIFFLKLILLIVSIVNASAAFDIKASTVILQDYLTGEILFEKEADRSIYPASMTKIMTSIIAFDLIKKGDLSLEDKFIVSEKAWRFSTSGYSSMFIMVNDEVSVENLLKGIIVASGNDACIALAEGIAGSEEEFAILMTSKAREIGMENTNFSNASGINHPDNYSTVRDIMIMSNYLIKNYPKFYELFKEKEFTWDRTGGDPIKQGNRNPLLYKSIGADGIKTGYLAVEKYSLASSILKNNRRLIAVASGFNSKNDRSKESSKLLIWGLTNFDVVEIAKKDKNLISLDVWLGKKENIATYIKKDLFKVIPKARKKYLKAVIEYNGPVKAPIYKNQVLGTLKVFFKGKIVDEYDLLAFEDVDKINIFARLIRSINYLIWGDV